MSKLYVRLYTGFFTHRKTLRLKAAIGTDAFWIPQRIWAYAVENQPDGDFSNYTAEEIASLIGYIGDASKMLEALLKAGFMDEAPLRIHDWGEHNSYHKTFSDRAKKAADARWAKKSPSTPSPNTEKDSGEGKGASIATSNASSIPPVIRVSHEKELIRVGNELEKMGQLSDHDKGSKKYNRHIELTARQIELRKLLGVTA